MPDMISKDLGPVSGYAIAVAHGYTGTEAQWIEEVLKGTQNAQTATQKAAEAAQSANTASQGATSASNSATTATQKASEAASSATAASGSAASASTSAGTATTKATEAAASASAAAADRAAVDTATNTFVNTTVPNAISAIEDKGEEVLDSIPSDYTTLSNDVSDLKSAIAYSGELKSGYITYNNGTYHSSSSRKYMEFPVSYGMSVKYSFNDGAAYNMGLAFYDVDGKYISGAIAQNQPQIVTVPEKAVLCKATARNQEDSVPVYYNSAIQINRINTLTSIKLDNTLFEYQENKYAYWATKNVADYTGLNIIVFPVFEGLTFVYSMKNSNPNAVGLHFRNSTGGYVSGVQATASPTTVVTPATATVCYASVYNPNEIQFVGVGNSLLQNASSAELNCGLQTTSEPLESISDATGMLDIFLHVGCIGDSLASGEAYWNDGGTTQGYDFYQYSWGQYLARKTGNIYYNWSKGGLSTKTWLTSEYATECFDGQHLCEAYIIGLGQNDANYDYTIGTSADINLTDYTLNADTFYGSYGKIIQKIKEVQPQAKIFVITDPNTSTNNKGYNTPIRDMATIFENVYVVDLQMYALKYMQSPVLIAQLRGGHFNAYGYKVLSMMIANYIDWIVTHDYTEFTQVELIGTGHSWT